MTRRLGQTCSQKPHSMHLSIHGETGGVRLMFLLTTSGSPLISTPGLSRPLGSMSFLIRVINEYALSPHSRDTYGAIARPVPCSAFNEPFNSSATRTTESTVKAMKRSISLCWVKSAVNTKWALPALACPNWTPWPGSV